jgi:hypothetical protein
VAEIPDDADGIYGAYGYPAYPFARYYGKQYDSDEAPEGVNKGLYGYGYPYKFGGGGKMYGGYAYPYKYGGYGYQYKYGRQGRYLGKQSMSDEAHQDANKWYSVGGYGYRPLLTPRPRSCQ